MAQHTQHLGTLWTDRLKDADRRRSDGGDSWLDAAVQSDAHFKGMFEHSAHGGEPITKNKQYAATRTIHAAVTPKNIRIEVTPIRPLDNLAASLMEDLLNWNSHVINLKETIDFVELDGQVKGVGITYVAWRQAATAEVKMGEGDQEAAALTNKKGDADEGLWDALATTMPHRLNGGHLTRVFHIDPYDFLIDPLATKMENARWAAHRIWLTKGEILTMVKDGFLDVKEEDLVYSEILESSHRFSNLHQEKNASELGMTPGDDDLSDRAEDAVWELWQAHDFKTKEVIWVIPGMKKAARSPRDNPLGNPYQDYRPNRTGDEFWSKPDSWIYAPAQQRLDQVIDSMAHLTNMMAKPAYMYSDEVDDIDVEQLKNAQPGQWIGVSSKLLDTLRPFNQDFNVPDAMPMLQASLESVITETCAVSEIASGALGGAGVTATAANLSAGSQSLRSGYNRRVLTAWLNETVRRMAFLLQTFFTQEDALPVLGVKAAEWNNQDGTDTNPSINRQLQGMLDFETHAGDEAEEAAVEQRKMSMDLLQIVAPMAQTGLLPGFDMPRFVRYILELNDYPADLVPTQQVQPQAPQFQEAGGQLPPGNARPVSGGPNSGTPNGSAQPPSPDALNRDRAPAAANIAQGAGTVR